VELESVGEQGAEENIKIQEVENDKKLERVG
jgi:hypothetical protein